MYQFLKSRWRIMFQKSCNACMILAWQSTSYCSSLLLRCFALVLNEFGFLLSKNLRTYFIYLEQLFLYDLTKKKNLKANKHFFWVISKNDSGLRLKDNYPDYRVAKLYWKSKDTIITFWYDLYIGYSEICSDIWHNFTTSDISILSYVISRALRWVKFETIFKHHEWYLCQISRTNPAVICLYYYPQRFCNFHM